MSFTAVSKQRLNGIRVGSLSELPGVLCVPLLAKGLPCSMIAVQEQSEQPLTSKDVSSLTTMLLQLTEQVLSRPTLANP